MNVHSSRPVAGTYVPSARLAGNAKLNESIESHLIQDLRAAVASGDRKLICGVLDAVISACADIMQPFFAVPYPRPTYSEESNLLMDCLRGDMRIRGFRLEFLPHMPEEVHSRLTVRLREAVVADTIPAIDSALKEITNTCRVHGFNSFRTPYADGSRICRLLSSRIEAIRAGLWLDWTEGGLVHEPDKPVHRPLRATTLPVSG